MTKEIIESGYSDLSNSIDISENTDLLKAVNSALNDLDKGKIRVAEKINDKQVTDAELFQDKCAACHESGFNEVKGGLAFFHAGDNGGLVENTRNTGSYAGLNSYTAEMSILSLISRPEDVRNVMPPEETHITKEEKIRIARYLMKYIDENQVGPDLKRELQAQIDAYSIRQ